MRPEEELKEPVTARLRWSFDASPVCVGWMVDAAGQETQL